MPVNEADDFMVALRQPHECDGGNTLKARQSGHHARVIVMQLFQKTCEFDYLGKILKEKLASSLRIHTMSTCRC